MAGSYGRPIFNFFNADSTELGKIDSPAITIQGSFSL